MNKAIYNSHLLKNKRTPLEEVIPLPAPYTVLIETSRLCNLRCNFCPQCDRNTFTLFKDNLLSMSDFGKISDQLKEFPQKIKKVYMHGTGESLLNAQLSEMVNLLKTEAVVESVDLTSNGILLSPETSLKLIDAGLDHLHISVEALSAEGYKEIAGIDKFNFDVFVENIRYFYNKKKNCRLTIKIANLSIKTSTDKENFFELFSSICDEIFIENIFPIWPNFEFPSIYQINEEGQYGQSVTEKKVCPQIFNNLAVKCNGGISACSMDWNNKMVLGNISQDTLLEVWNGTALKELQLKHLKHGKQTVPLCESCELPKYSCIDNIDPFSDVLISRIQS